MKWRQRGWLGSALLCTAVACAGAPPSASVPTPPASAATESPATSGDPAEPATHTEGAPSAASASSSSVPASASASVPSTAPPPVSVLALCQAKCDRLLRKCAAPQVDSCRLNCSKFDPPPPGCDGPVRAALECARDARDLTCANVAPESCARKFRDLSACAAGEPIEHTESVAPGIPSGWERVSDPAHGFSVVLPSGSTSSQGPEGPVRSVTASDGTRYTVSVLPLLKDKVSEKSLLHFLMKVQGRCSDKSKLDGFIEKAGRSSIHYSAHCPDKTEWDGMIYVNQRHLFLLSAQAPAGSLGLTEPFFYQFEFNDG